MENYSEPILDGRGATDYERYIRTDELLALQKAPADQAHRDELLFQTVHQTAELWLKLACTEIEEATARLVADDPAGSHRLLRRATDVLKLITHNLHMLEHMSPWDYQQVRTALGHGSGFDSPGFTHLLEAVGPLGEAFMASLTRRDLTLMDVYRRDREFEDHFQVGERLIDLDEWVALWRFHHFQIVRRTIGAHVIGTQGTPVEVLGKRIAHQLYPELWEVRDRLTALANEPR